MNFAGAFVATLTALVTINAHNICANAETAFVGRSFSCASGTTCSVALPNQEYQDQGYNKLDALTCKWTSSKVTLLKVYVLNATNQTVFMYPLILTTDEKAARSISRQDINFLEFKLNYKLQVTLVTSANSQNSGKCYVTQFE